MPWDPRGGRGFGHCPERAFDRKPGRVSRGTRRRTGSCPGRLLWVGQGFLGRLWAGNDDFAVDEDVEAHFADAGVVVSRPPVHRVRYSIAATEQEVIAGVTPAV